MDGNVTEASFGLDLAMAVGGGALLFLGLIISAVWWMPVLMRGAGALVSASGPSAKIAASNVAKNPRRVAATGVALLIGVTLVTAISTGAASARQTVNDYLSEHYAVDITMTGGSLDKAALKAVSKVKGVGDAALLNTAQGTADKSADKTSGKTTDKASSKTDLSVALVGISEQDRSALMRVDVANAAGNASNAPGTVVMNSTLYDGTKNPYKNGDVVKVTVQKNDGTKQMLSLIASLKDFVPMTETQITALVDPSVLEASTGIATSSVIWMRVGEAPSAVQFMSDVQDAVSKYQGVSVSGPFAEREMWETSINVIMATLIGLLAVSVIIALIGVANTLSLSVIERTRESATLRAIGMTRGQLRSSLGVEALIIAVVAGLAGLVLGVGFGWLGSEVILSTIGTVKFRVDWVMCAIVLGIAVVAALISSIAPARRAVRTSPVVALAEA
jgi:putative ABC transport system permease protein